MKLRLGLTLFLLGVAGIAAAQIGLPKISVDTGLAKSPDEVSSSLQILALLTVLSLAPALMILTTSFTRIVIILGFLRNALGTPTLPPNQVVIGLSLFLTFYVMGPTYEQVHQKSLKPYMEKRIGFDDAMKRAEKPIRDFMIKNTYERDLVLFLDMRGEKPMTRDDVKLVTLVPAFVISELKTAFVVGFYIFIPFILIDLIVASGLMSMGMMMLPPTVVSLPAKLLIFLLADGWHTLSKAILQGYG